MKKLSILMILVFFIVGVSVYSFDSERDKKQALSKINQIQNSKIREKLINNILTGKINNVEQINSVINDDNHIKNYYSKINLNLEGNDFADQLRKLIDNHTCLGYIDARKAMYGFIDNNNGFVSGIYTGRKYKYSKKQKSSSTEQYRNKKLQKMGKKNKETVQGPKTDILKTRAQKHFLNCEHSWPQSFFNKKEPMRSDIHHLFSADSVANGIRSSYPFGKVVKVKWSENGSKLGRGENGKTVFEPRDCSKGDIARGLMYFSIRYNDKIPNYEEKYLRLWNKLDPPDAAEKLRNSKIEKFQHNRNPFVDHPEYADRISDF